MSSSGGDEEGVPIWPKFLPRSYKTSFGLFSKWVPAYNSSSVTGRHASYRSPNRIELCHLFVSHSHTEHLPPINGAHIPRMYI